jgi:NADH:ubiquinone oxidoreductase subunit
MVTSKQKQQYPPAEAQFLPPPAQRFWELYKCAFTGLHSQFEQYAQNGDLGGLTVYYDGEDKDSMLRSQHFAWVAYNSATEACKLLAEQDAITNFNRKA